MPKNKDITGVKFSKLLALYRTDRILDEGRRPYRGYYMFRCDCGVEKEIIKRLVVRGTTISCGCAMKERVRNMGYLNTTHGHSRGKNTTKEYRAWCHLNQRCTPGNKYSKNYYDRGIRVYDGWVGKGGFVRFFEHVGPCPDKTYSIDRIQNDSGYFPGNVRWASKVEQAYNRRTPIRLDKFTNKQVFEECKRRGIISPSEFRPYAH